MIRDLGVAVAVERFHDNVRRRNGFQARIHQRLGSVGQQLCWRIRNSDIFLRAPVIEQLNSGQLSGKKWITEREIS